MSPKAQAILEAIGRADHILCIDQNKDREIAEYWNTTGDLEEDETIVSFPSGDNTLTPELLEKAEIVPGGDGFKVDGAEFKLSSMKPVKIKTARESAPKA
jgi:hypothetical protein